LIIGAVASFFIAKELFTDPVHHDQEPVMNGSQSGDSITSTLSNQSSFIYGRHTNSPPRSGGEKSLVSYIPQFNPFATRHVGSVESRPRTHIAEVINLPTELTPLNKEETKDNGTKASYV
jgi:hypothetical protein